MDRDAESPDGTVRILVSCGPGRYHLMDTFRTQWSAQREANIDSNKSEAQAIQLHNRVAARSLWATINIGESEGVQQ